MSVSATGRELSVDVGGALDQDVGRGALSQEQRRAYKSKRHNEKEHIAETRQRNHLLGVRSILAVRVRQLYPGGGVWFNAAPHRCGIKLRGSMRGREIGTRGPGSDSSRSFGGIAVACISPRCETRPAPSSRSPAPRHRSATHAPTLSADMDHATPEHSRRTGSPPATIEHSGALMGVLLEEARRRSFAWETAAVGPVIPGSGERVRTRGNASFAASCGARNGDAIERARTV